METHVNIYQGLNKDIAYDTIGPNLYIDALDIRITTTTGESTGAWTNIKGNSASFLLPASNLSVPSGNNFGTWTASNPVVIGSTSIRSTIVLFVADSSNTKGWIYTVKYDPATRLISAGYPQLKYYNANFNFSKLHPIEAMGRYESDCLQRVYWTDYNNFFRSINLESPTITTLALGQIDIFPDITYNQPLLKIIGGGGALMTGQYQIAYRLITFDGKESLFSPPSNPIHIVSSSETVPQSYQYVGNPVAVNSGKSIQVTIDTSSYSGYEYLEVVYIYNATTTSTPVVQTIEQISIGTSTSITVKLTGNETGGYPLELLSFTTKNNPFKTPKTITQKDNSLVVANIKSSTVSVQSLLAPGETFSAETLRYKSDGVTACTDSFNQDYNIDAHWDALWHKDKQYKYQTDGTTLGGEGPNIQYSFHLEPYRINTVSTPGIPYVPNTPVTTHNLNDGYTYTNTTFDSPASPFISGLLRGYKRGETYRFGIVFYTKKGEATYVSHIGDIKFPDLSEADGVTNLSGTNYFPIATDSGYIVTGYSLGIKFQIDFSSCPSLLTEVESYQIVRVERTNLDKRRICSGTFKTFSKPRVGTSVSGVEDFRVNGSEDVLHLLDMNGGPNGSFTRLESAPSDGSIYPDLFGEYINFISPEIFYDYNSIPATIDSVPEPMILINGGLDLKNDTVTTRNTSAGEQVGQQVQDYRRNYTKTVRVDKTSTNVTYPTIGAYRGIEYVKRLTYKQKVKNQPYGTLSDSTTTAVGGYYMRNFYAFADPATSATLNKPNNESKSVLYRGPSGLLGKMSKISNDPISGASLGTVSSTDYFNTTNVVAVGASGTHTLVWADVLIPKQEIYGGFDSNALVTNKFIGASPVISTANTNPIVYGGDIFIDMHINQESTTFLDPDFYDASTGTDGRFVTNRTITGAFPCESSINLSVTHGSTLQRTVLFAFNSTYISSLYRQETGNYSSTYAKSLNMYDYNGIYSKENSDVTFYVEPISGGSCSDLVQDTRAYLSNVKTNNELVDSWSKFGVNNFYDIDDYGPINKILNWQDTVHFIQDRAIGVYAINRAAITTTSDGVPTQLGTGQGFGKHQYFSKEHGSIHQWGITSTEKGIYFFDGIHRKIFICAGQNSPISEALGIHSVLQALPSEVFTRKENGGDNPLVNKGVVLGKDLINDEIIFTFLSTNKENSSTYVLDEVAQVFATRYSATPTTWISNGDILLSPNPSANNQLWTHNIGSFGQFYGTNKECSISVVINTQADLNKVLRTIEFNSIVRDSAKVVDRSQTITAFRIQNQYQDTGKVLFSSGRIKRKFDKWRLKIPRDQNTVNKKGRIRSSYFVLTLYFDNSSNKELIMNRVITYFDYQMF